MNKTVENYLLNGCGRCELAATKACKVHRWSLGIELLRKIVLSCGLLEEVKWGVPCYTYNNQNVLILSALKDYFCISFFKGSLLSNDKNLLIKPGKNSQAARLFKFTNIEQAEAHESDIRTFIQSAIEIEQFGLKVNYKKLPEPLPEELLSKFEEDFLFKTAFESLTPGRQRGYVIYFSQPKQSKTRIARINKCEAKILNGEGLHDKYQSKK